MSNNQCFSRIQPRDISLSLIPLAAHNPHKICKARPVWPLLRVESRRLNEVVFKHSVHGMREIPTFHV